MYIYIYVLTFLVIQVCSVLFPEPNLAYNGVTTYLSQKKISNTCMTKSMQSKTHMMPFDQALVC